MFVRAVRRWLAPLAGLLLGLFSYRPAQHEARALAVLSRLAAKPGETPSLVRLTPSGTTQRGDLVLGENGRSFAARLYVPPGSVDRCLVVAHGVHYKGIDEPRLTRFAEALASTGVVVLTPELRDLADYHITRSGADVLADATRYLSTRCRDADHGKVGLLGFSFAGGLSLLAALDPSVEAHLAFVASVGGYHDLSRVLRFLLTNRVETLHGPEPRAAHEYGLVVLLYQNLDALVPEEDRATMQAAVRAWLHEDRKSAWTFASRRTTAAAESLFVRITQGQAGFYRPALEERLSHAANELRALSPRGRLSQLQVPVYLLHGSGDSVIPPEETEFADRELGSRPHVALVTPLIEHVELSSAPALADAAKLVDFISKLL
jgi:dienelactone hydrolase